MTTAVDLEKVKVSYKLTNITEVMEEEVKELVEKNLEGKMTSSFKKIVANHPDTDIKVDVILEKNEQTRYVGSITLSYAGKSENYNNKDKPFKILADLVNHAFKNIKEKVLEK